MNNQEENSVNGNEIQNINTEDASIKSNSDIEPRVNQDVKPKRTRRDKVAIDNEYKEFKKLFNEGNPILGICAKLKIKNSQCTNYLGRLSLEERSTSCDFDLCHGHNLHEPIRQLLGGNKTDLFEYKKVENGVLITLHVIEQ